MGVAQRGTLFSPVTRDIWNRALAVAGGRCTWDDSLRRSRPLAAQHCEPDPATGPTRPLAVHSPYHKMGRGFRELHIPGAIGT